MVGPHGGKMDSVKVDSFTGDLQASCHSGTEWRSLLHIASSKSDLGQGMDITADRIYRCTCPEVMLPGECAVQSTSRTSSSTRTLMFPSHTLSCSSLQPQDTSRAIQVRCAFPMQPALVA